MTTVHVHGGIDILRLPVNKEEHYFRPWNIKYTKSHILHSKCSKHEQSCDDDPDPCQFCVYNRALKMPHIPDMVFPNNILTLSHDSNAKIEFIPLEALKRVSNGKINVQVACADAWKESRLDCKKYLHEKIKPFDWTFTTDYMGTLTGFEVEDTEEKIDMEKLKKQDGIFFYQELTLFEDELHDNGVASLTVKIRVMQGRLFILLRYFLRLDHSLLRINDTRIFHEFDKNYMLREYTSREAKVRDISAPKSLYLDPTFIAPHLPLIKSSTQKLIFSDKSTSDITESTDESTNLKGESSQINDIPVKNTSNEKIEAETSNSVI